MNKPIVCILSEDQLRERRATVLASLRAAAKSVRKVENGFLFEFDSGPEIVAMVRKTVELEQACCAFLNFRIVESGFHLLLEITGPAAAQPIIADFFGA
jgi:hypothetical protein